MKNKNIPQKVGNVIMSTVNQKYIKDENGNIISPITSSNSVYTPSGYNITPSFAVLLKWDGNTKYTENSIVKSSTWYNIHYGNDIIPEGAKNQIKIQNCTYVEVGGCISGNAKGYTARLRVTDIDNKGVPDSGGQQSIGDILILNYFTTTQYFSVPFPTAKYVQLDPTKTYYCQLEVRTL